MSYRVNEIFYSLQGEGIRAGTANVFVRFSGCNLECSMEPGPRSPGGFDCDTEFMSGRTMLGTQIIAEAERIAPDCRNVILTGGEPVLQLDSDLYNLLREKRYHIAIETNGSMPVPFEVDWITVAPKVAEHAIRQHKADEVRYVRHYGQGIPRPSCDAVYQLISPAFDGNSLSRDNLSWCIQLVKENPQWRLSVQQHKFWSVR